MYRREETNHVFIFIYFFYVFIFKPVQAHLILLCFSDIVSYKLEIFGNAVSSKSISTIFYTAFPYFVSLSHFSNSYSISDFYMLLYLPC